jgi:hypothetical protein
MYDDNCEHEDLLALAGQAELAARSHDHATLLTTTRHLLTMLAMHLDNEQHAQRVLDHAVAEHRARDEQKLVEDFVKLVEAATRSGGQCRCETLARNALRRLRHQIEVEADTAESDERALRHHRPGSRDPGWAQSCHVRSQPASSMRSSKRWT